MAAPAAPKGRAGGGGLQIAPLQVILIGVVVMMAIGAAFYFLVLKKKDDQIKSVNTEVSTLSTTKANLEDQRRNLTRVQDQAERIRKRLTLLQDRLPTSQEQLDEFLADINQRQQNARVEQWLLYAPQPSVPDGEIERIPIQMEFLATFDAATAFFWELSAMGADDKSYSREQIVNVTNFGFRRDDSLGTGLVRVSCVAETFLYKGGAPKPADSDSGSSRRKRK